MEKVVPQVGIEPTTYRLQGGCSASELLRRGCVVTLHVWFCKGKIFGRANFTCWFWGSRIVRFTYAPTRRRSPVHVRPPPASLNT